jgi:hypothetical protein
MAFQTGTQIRPELANADYSGFVNAANIRAQAMMNLGEQIGGGIREYQKNKEIKGELTGQIEGSLTADPGLLASLQQLNDVSASVKKMQEGSANKKDLLMIHGAIGSIQNIKDRQRQVEAQEVEKKIKLAQLQDLEAHNSATKQAVAVSTDTEGNIDWSSVLPSYIELGGSQPEAIAKMIEGVNKGEPLSDKERWVNTLVDTLGISPSLAVSIVQGTQRVVTDPVSGDIAIYDEATGKTTPIDPSPDVAQQIKGEAETKGDPQVTLAAMARESTGLINSLKLAAQRVAGQAGMQISDAPEIANMRQQVDVAKRSLIRALALNPRYPVSEQEAVAKEINISPSAFNDPITMQAQLQAVDTALRERLDDEIMASNNKSLPKSTRQAARQSANDIQNFLDLLGADDIDSQNGKDINSVFDEETAALINKYAPQ